MTAEPGQAAAPTVRELTKIILTHVEFIDNGYWEHRDGEDVFVCTSKQIKAMTDAAEKAAKAIQALLPRAPTPETAVARVPTRAAICALLRTYDIWNADHIAGEIEALFPRAPTLEWQPMRSVPKDRLIDLWMPSGVRWINCYWDNICSEWRCITASGHMLTCKTALFWRECPAPGEEG